MGTETAGPTGQHSQSVGLPSCIPGNWARPCATGPSRTSQRNQSEREKTVPARRLGSVLRGTGGGGTGSPGEASAGLSGHPWATHDWPVARNWAKSRGPLSMPDRRGIIGRTARTGQPSFSPLSLLALAAVASSGKGWQLARQTRNKRETAWSTPNRHKLTAPPSRAPGPSRSVPGHLARTRRCRFVG